MDLPTEDLGGHVVRRAADITQQVTFFILNSKTEVYKQELLYSYSGDAQRPSRSGLSPLKAPVGLLL